MDLLAPYSDPLTVAGINATVLSLVIGALAAYALYVYGKIDDLKTAVLQETERTKEVKPPSAIIVGKDYDISDAESRKKILTELVSLVIGKDKDIPREQATRGERVVGALGALCQSSLFPKRNEVSGSIAPMAFNDIDEARRWALEIAEISEPILWLSTTHKAKLEECLKAYDDRYSFKFKMPTGNHKIEMSKAEIDDYKLLNRTIDPSERASLSISSMSKAGEIAESVKLKLTYLEAYQKRQPARILLVVWLVGASLAFASGVIYPMIDSNAANLYVLWIPIGFYALSLFGILSWVARR